MIGNFFPSDTNFNSVTRRVIFKAAAVIEYDAKLMDAPMLSAKGTEYNADAIVQIARKYGVPLVERPEITRTLSLVEEGTLIPESLFRAVALILTELDRVLKH